MRSIPTVRFSINKDKLETSVALGSLDCSAEGRRRVSSKNAAGRTRGLEESASQKTKNGPQTGYLGRDFVGSEKKKVGMKC